MVLCTSDFFVSPYEPAFLKATKYQKIIMCIIIIINFPVIHFSIKIF